MDGLGFWLAVKSFWLIAPTRNMMKRNKTAQSLALILSLFTLGNTPGNSANGGNLSYQRNKLHQIDTKKANCGTEGWAE